LASALVGYLVERISQTPFDTYCKNNIFLPLGMTKTEWRLANTPISELVVPYSADIPNQNNPHYTFPDYPNGGLRTTTLDLANFLRAIIQNGTLNGTQILSASSMMQMETLQFGSTEQCLSFYYDSINGKRVLGHTGGEKGVTTAMYYDTDTNIGVIVFNNDDDANLDDIVTLLFNYGETD
jgi:CubicO group peptidase (beta-lactamase class C family)